MISFCKIIMISFIIYNLDGIACFFKSLRNTTLMGIRSDIRI